MARHRRQRKHSNASYRFFNAEFYGNERSEFPLREKLLEYFINLLGQGNLSEAVLTFAFESMEPGQRIDTLDFIYDGVTEVPVSSKKTNNYEQVRSYLHDMGRFCDNIIEDIYYRRLRRTVREIGERITAVLADKLRTERSVNRGAFERRLDELQRVFNLGSDDVTVLLFLYCAYETNLEYLSDLQNDVDYNEFVRIISTAVDLPLASVKRVLHKQSRLYSFGLLEEIDTKRQNFFDLSDVISDYLAGVSERSLIDQSIMKDSGDTLDPDSFTIDGHEKDIILRLLRSNGPANILFYGKAGTGKTEFSRAIARATGKEVYLLQHGEDENSGNDDGSRVMALRVAVNTVPADRGIIIADEADYILNTVRMFLMSRPGMMEKGRLNSFLDDAGAKIIWISNEVTFMEESTLRRFAYSLSFKAFTTEERKNVWRNRLAGHPMKRFITDDLVARLSEDYRVNAGGIASALDALKHIYRGERPGKKRVEETLRELLGRHENLVTGRLDSRHGNRGLRDLVDAYDPAVLNCDTDPAAILSAVSACADDMKAPGRNGKNLNLLFWGPPGTGKTEFVKYCSREAGLRYILKRYSDLESKWVGETEKNIATAFREAEEQNAILFIDESDSFFTSRESAFRSWEVSRTNELLTQMENHGGIFVCCTNLLPTMDRAAMRRFHFKVEFRPMKPEARVILYRKYFRLKGRRLTGGHRQRIAAIDGLTPGDIRAVWQRLQYMGDNIDHGFIIAELEREASYRRIGEIEKVGF